MKYVPIKKRQVVLQKSMIVLKLVCFYSIEQRSHGEGRKLLSAILMETQASSLLWPDLILKKLDVRSHGEGTSTILMETQASSLLRPDLILKVFLFIDLLKLGRRFWVKLSLVKRTSLTRWPL